MSSDHCLIQRLQSSVDDELSKLHGTCLGVLNYPHGVSMAVDGNVGSLPLFTNGNLCETMFSLRHCVNGRIYLSLPNISPPLDLGDKESPNNGDAAPSNDLLVAELSNSLKMSAIQIEMVQSFKYLGRVLSEDDDDWLAILSNICKARQRWGQVARILAREGASTRAMGYFYKAIVQAVLLYASETWVITERAMKALNSFHHHCARYIAGDHIRQLPNGEWYLPETARVLEQ